MRAGMRSQTGKGQGPTNQPCGKSRTGDARLLGNGHSHVMKERFSVRHEQAMQLQGAWDEVMPQELSDHCRIESFSAGRLAVVVDGPGYMHELRLCKKELCDEMNARLSGVRIRDIKMAVGF